MGVEGSSGGVQVADIRHLGFKDPVIDLVVMGWVGRGARSQGMEGTGCDVCVGRELGPMGSLVSAGRKISGSLGAAVVGRGR